MSAAEARPGTVHDVRDFLERARGYKLIRLSLGDILYRAYLVFGIGGFYAAVALSGLVDPTSTTPTSQLDGDVLRGVMVGGAALALLAILRISTWAGPVMVGREDAAWLLPTPVDRRHLLRPHLVGGVVMGAMTGTAFGVAIMFIVLAIRPIAAIEALWAGALGGMLLGLLGAAAGWFVEARPVLARRLYRGSWAGWIAAIALGWLAAVVPASIWLGPWGWVVAGFVDASAEPVAGWPLSLVLVALLGGAVMWAADRNLAEGPDEELRRRAGLFSAVSTSLTFFNARTIADAYSTGVLRFRRIPRFRVPMPRQPWALPMWIDLVTLLRRRESVFRSQVAMLLAGVLVATSPKHVGVTAVAGVLAYFAATPLVAQLRDTMDQPARAGPIPLGPTGLLLAHLVVPSMVLVAEMAVTVGLLTAAGPLELAAMPSALAAGTVACASILLVAAVAATRGQPPLHLMSSGEQGSMLIFAWFALGPILSVMLVGFPAGAVAGDPEAFGGGGPTAVALSAAVWFAALELPVLIAVLLSRGRKRIDPPDVVPVED